MPNGQQTRRCSSNAQLKPTNTHTAAEGGVGLGAETPEMGIWLSDLGGERLVSAVQQSEGHSCVSGGGVGGAGP